MENINVALKPKDYSAFKRGLEFEHFFDENPYDRLEEATEWLAFELGRKYAIEEFKAWRESRKQQHRDRLLAPG